MVLLVRYGELALKSSYVRRGLEDRLAANVREMFAANGAECIVKVERGRLFVHAEDELVALRLLRRVFGIVSLSPAREATSDLESLTRDVVAYAQGVIRPGTSFAVRARRSGEHPYTSQDLAVRLGRAIQDAVPRLAVDLEAPDREVHVEVRGPRAYVFHEIVPGPGGLPLGSQGEALAEVRNEDDVVSAWLLMRRGCRLRVAAPEPLAAVLRAWDPKLVPASEETADLAALAERDGLPIAPSSGDRVSAGTSLVLRPLLGFTPAEIAKMARSIRAA